MPKETLTEQETRRVRDWLNALHRRHTIRWGALAAEARVSPDTLRKYRNGQATRMERAKVDAVSEALGLDRGALVAHARGELELMVPTEHPQKGAEDREGRLDALERDVRQMRRSLDDIKRLLGNGLGAL